MSNEKGGSSKKTPAQHTSRRDLQSKTSTTETNANFTTTKTTSQQLSDQTNENQLIIQQRDTNLNDSNNGTTKTSSTQASQQSTNLSASGKNNAKRYVPPNLRGQAPANNNDQTIRSTQFKPENNDSDDKDNGLNTSNNKPIVISKCLEPFRYTEIVSNFNNVLSVAIRITDIAKSIYDEDNEQKLSQDKLAVLSESAIHHAQHLGYIFFLEIHHAVQRYGKHIDQFNANQVQLYQRKEHPPAFQDCNDFLNKQSYLKRKHLFRGEYKSKNEALVCRIRNCYAHGMIDYRKEDKTLIFRSNGDSGAANLEATISLFDYLTLLKEWIYTWREQLGTWANDNGISIE